MINKSKEAFINQKQLFSVKCDRLILKFNKHCQNSCLTRKNKILSLHKSGLPSFHCSTKCINRKKNGICVCVCVCTQTSLPVWICDCLPSHPSSPKPGSRLGAMGSKDLFMRDLNSRPEQPYDLVKHDCHLLFSELVPRTRNYWKTIEHD